MPYYNKTLSSTLSSLIHLCATETICKETCVSSKYTYISLFLLNHYNCSFTKIESALENCYGNLFKLMLQVNKPSIHAKISEDWWHTPLIPASSRQRQADLFQGQPGLQGRFQASQGYIKKKKKSLFQQTKQTLLCQLLCLYFHLVYHKKQ